MLLPYWNIKEFIRRRLYTLLYHPSTDPGTDPQYFLKITKNKISLMFSAWMLVLGLALLFVSAEKKLGISFIAFSLLLTACLLKRAVFAQKVITLLFVCLLSFSHPRSFDNSSRLLMFNFLTLVAFAMTHRFSIALSMLISSCSNELYQSFLREEISDTRFRADFNTVLFQQGFSLIFGLSLLWLLENQVRSQRFVGELYCKLIQEKHNREKTDLCTIDQLKSKLRAQEVYFMSLISDLRNTITPILGNLSSALECSENHECTAALRKVEICGQYLKNQLSNSQILEKIRKNIAVETFKIPTDTKQFFEDNWKQLRDFIRTKKLVGHLHYNGQIPAQIFIDSAQLKQILTNLTSVSLQLVSGATLQFLVSWTKKSTQQASATKEARSVLNAFTDGLDEGDHSAPYALSFIKTLNQSSMIGPVVLTEPTQRNIKESENSFRFERVFSHRQFNRQFYQPSSKEEGELRVCIIYEGKGIPSADKRFLTSSDIFALLAENSLQNPALGLSLWVMNKLVRLAGGRIEIENNEASGRNSIIIYIPTQVFVEPPNRASNISTARDREKARTIAMETPPLEYCLTEQGFSSTKKPKGIARSSKVSVFESPLVKRVLRAMVIDPNKENQLALTKILRNDKFELLYLIGEGNEALETLEATGKGAVDIIFVNMELTDMKGSTCMRAIREMEKGQGFLPSILILIVNSAELPEIEAALDMRGIIKAHGHLVTPLFQTNTLEVIENSLRIAKSLLIVDAYPLSAELISDYSEKMGINCTSINDGEAAIEMVRTHSFNLRMIIIEKNLPGMNGVEVTKRIKQLLMKMKAPGIPVILCSADEDSQLEMNEPMIINLFDDFLQKPFDFQHFTKLLYDHLE